MAKILQFKARPKPDTRVEEFIEQLEDTKTLFLDKHIDDVFIIATGEDLKCCTSSGVTLEKALKMCRDFIKNYREYTDDEE